MLIKDKYQDFLHYLKQKDYAFSTLHNYQLILKGALSHSVQDIKLKSFKLTDVAKIIEAGKDHGRYGALRGVSVFRQYLKFLYESGHKLSFDWRDVRLPKTPLKEVEYLTPEEIEKVRNSLGSSLTQLRTRALIEIITASGLRISEVLSLDKKDIDWYNKETVVENCKTKERQKVLLTDKALYWLGQYLNARNDNWQPLFTSQTGKRMPPGTARTYLRKQAKKLGINKHICHTIFRKTLATSLIQNGADIKTVQTIMRHKSPRTTLRVYTGLSIERCKSEHKRIVEKI